MSNTLVWQNESGKMVLLPQRGRVLQVSLDGHDAFWAPEQTVIDPSDWNAGGDRLWTGPESDWFWKTRSAVDFEKYEIPARLDPGSWTEKSAQPNYCGLQQTVVLQHQHTAESIEFDLARSVQLLDWPDAPYFQNYLSYRTDNELKLKRGPLGQSLDVWSILQLPAGGTLLVGTRGETTPRDYFAPIPAELWTQDSQTLQLQLTGRAQYKIGVAPQLCTGRLAYARRIDGRYLVVYRQFFVQPWLHYCDSPLLDSGGQGDAVQVYNDSGDFGGFGEMEFHSPAITCGEGPQHLSDSYLTIVGFVAEQDWQPWKEHWLHQN